MRLYTSICQTSHLKQCIHNILILFISKSYLICALIFFFNLKLLILSTNFLHEVMGPIILFIFIFFFITYYSIHYDMGHIKLYYRGCLTRQWLSKIFQILLNCLLVYCLQSNICKIHKTSLVEISNNLPWRWMTTKF